MPRIARIIVPHYPRHITSRGNHRAGIFLDDEDRSTSLSILQTYSERCAVAVWAYCLMYNHVHLLAVPPDQGALSRCTGRTNLVYTQHVNRRCERSGRIWQNRFFSTVVDRETYLWAVVRYIEQTPVKAHLASRPEDYRWSSRRQRHRRGGSGSARRGRGT